MNEDRDMIIWTEKYRPNKIADCILTDNLKQIFNDVLKSGNLPHFLFSGDAGIGKTTVAKALCEELDVDWKMINGSLFGNIDTLRTDILQFASTVSLSGGAYKVIILDEADFLNSQSTQPALRGFMEEFAENCRFILTCNFKNKILPALQSRCSVVDFKFSSKEKPQIAEGLFERVCYILDTEKVKYDKKVIAELIMKHFPDMRRVLNELQKYSLGGKIDTGILSLLTEVNIKSLISFFKEKKWNEVRKWVVQNLDSDPARIYRAIYDNMQEYVEPSSLPVLVRILHEFQYKCAFVADREINLVAALTVIMSECKFK